MTTCDTNSAAHASVSVKIENTISDHRYFPRTGHRSGSMRPNLVEVGDKLCLRLVILSKVTELLETNHPRIDFSLKRRAQKFLKIVNSAVILFKV